MKKRSMVLEQMLLLDVIELAEPGDVVVILASKGRRRLWNSKGGKKFGIQIQL